VSRLSLYLPLLAACKVLPPPPVMAPHAPTAPDDRGTTTAMIIVGTAGEVLGGGGWGVALRVEHQETERTTIGVELTGGRGDRGAWDDNTLFRHYLIAARAYGRYARIDEIALTYGAGLSWMRTGMITGSVHGSFAASYPNDYFVPYASVHLALVTPLRAGDEVGSEPTAPRTSLYLGGSLGGVVPIDAHAPSFDLTLSNNLLGKNGVITRPVSQKMMRNRNT
jgi:hypothetical protein